MSNFVGVVTQQDMQTGLTLRARVTSPKGNYTAYQDFKCMVKKAGLTDEQAVATDLNTISNNLLAFGVTGIISNITSQMPSVGENETNVKYDVIGDDIREYFNSDGIVIKRPAYGNNAVIGSLNISVNKNKAEANRDITISIEPYTAEELVESVLNDITWNSIRGQNGVETSDPATNGMFNVIKPLNLMKTLNNKLTESTITVTWSVVEDILSASLESKSRMDIDTGVITRPAYSSVLEEKDATIPGSLLEIAQSKIENAYGRTYMRIGGLKLKASISIEDSVSGGVLSNSTVFSLKTLSRALTNNEVSEFLTDNINLFNIKDTKYNAVYSLSSIKDVTERTIFSDSSGEASSVLEMYGKDAILAATLNNELTNTGISVISSTWSTIDPATVDSTPMAIPTTGYSLDGLQRIGDSSVLILNPTSKPVDPKLILRCVISVNSYDGAISYITAFYRFNLDDVTPSDN